MTLQQKVSEIIADSLGVDALSLSRSDSIVGDLGADSLDIVELTMTFEEEFGIEISDEDTEKLLTVGAIVDYLKRRGIGNDFSDDGEEGTKTMGGLEVKFVPIDE